MPACSRQPPTPLVTLTTRTQPAHLVHEVALLVRARIERLAQYVSEVLLALTLVERVKALAKPHDRVESVAVNEAALLAARLRDVLADRRRSSSCD